MTEQTESAYNGAIIMTALCSGEVPDEHADAVKSLTSLAVPVDIGQMIVDEMGARVVADERGAKRNDDETWTITLTQPVTWPVLADKSASTNYATLTLAIPRGIHLLAADERKGETAREFAVIASQCSVPYDVIANLHAYDLETVRFVAGYMRGKPRAKPESTKS